MCMFVVMLCIRLEEGYCAGRGMLLLLLLLHGIDG